MTKNIFKKIYNTENKWWIKFYDKTILVLTFKCCDRYYLWKCFCDIFWQKIYCDLMYLFFLHISFLTKILKPISPKKKCVPKNLLNQISRYHQKLFSPKKLSLPKKNFHEKTFLTKKLFNRNFFQQHYFTIVSFILITYFNKKNYY